MFEYLPFGIRFILSCQRTADPRQLCRLRLRRPPWHHPFLNGVASSEIADRIARAAARLFAAEGYDATSVRNIVEAAEVTKPTLYYYFESKEALAQPLLTDAIDKLAAGAARNPRRSGARRPKSSSAVIEEHFRLCRDDPDRARFAYAMFFGPRSSHLSAVLADLGQELAELVS